MTKVIGRNLSDLRRWLANDPTGIISVLLVVSVGGLIWVARKRLPAAENELPSPHGPNVVVRLELVHPPNGAEPIRIDCTAFNMGEANAEIIQRGGAIVLADTLPKGAELNDCSVGAVPVPGGTRHYSWTMIHTPTHEETSAYKAGARHLFCVGYLIHRDERDGLHYLGFCRRLDPETQRFVATDDPNYEYAYSGSPPPEPSARRV